MIDMNGNPVCETYGDEVGLTSPAWTTPFFETAAKITPLPELTRAWMPDGSPAKRDWKEVCE